MRRPWILTVAVCVLASCMDGEAPKHPPLLQVDVSEPAPDPAVAASAFVEVVDRMEPVITRECKAWAPYARCDFTIAVDDRPGQPPNAYQTLDKAGDPVIAFTVPLILAARNEDELAFVLGHEAAHHIKAHIPRQRENALQGAIALGIAAAASGAAPQAVREAQKLGAGLGTRAYAKEYELEADRLGVYLTWAAGFDPNVGAMFFDRLPDPGNAFLGTHPPNAARLATVRDAIARLPDR